MITELQAKCIYNTYDAERDFILTVAIPTYKRYDMLRESLQSVLQCSFDFSIEIIIVDNDPDFSIATEKFISDFSEHKFRYYKNSENYGMAGNWNQCLSLAKGEYVTILHDDDLLLPQYATVLNKIYNQNEFIENDLLGFNIDILDQRKDELKVNHLGILEKIKKISISNKTKKIRGVDIKDIFYSNLFSVTFSVVMRRNMAIKLGGFDGEMYPISDYHFWARWIFKYGEAQIRPEVVGLYRKQENESLRPDVMAAFITKNRQMREELAGEFLCSPLFEMSIKLRSELDKLDCDFLWAGNQRKFGVIKSAYYMMLKVTFAIIVRTIKLKRKNSK
ncbi:glycosyltransferase family 2 protein [Citrobacter sp. ku-bf4]|uniref:glycosyltransferase family 2 protein n=1 Tax=Citrobacter TaxID=544 RepID=UPI00197EF6A8|nr:MULTISPECIES: glycosyltransferase family 2 protein [Citrobacter]MBN6046142.1 glycosyltransferase family 2 protein [Citrobacter sp. ku-bf4]MBS0827658.1 glycosyltransferase family 2 protein [Citrobacter amalonaticus]